MRTTITLPAELHDVLAAVAHDRRQTLSETVTELLLRSLMPAEPAHVDADGRSGLPVVRVGRVVTHEDVRSLEDDG